jgi:hypothetical protein
MKKIGKKSPRGAVSHVSEGFWSNLLFLSIHEIGTSWCSLRSGTSRVKASELRDMPIRVVLQDGRYEVIDGFKRLERWKQSGIDHVPVLVECCSDVLSPKRFLLEANSPKRTICAVDEAMVIESMISDDGLTVRSVANILGRRKEWVIGRRSLLRLSPGARKLLESGRINLMVARLLTAISHKDQDAILETVEKHSLKMLEIQLFIQTWRSASDEEKPSLLADPLFKREQQDSPSHSARLKALEAKLSAIRNTLNEFQNLIIPQDLAEAEQRRLQAICASIQSQINQMADGIKSEVSDVAPISSDKQQSEDVQPLINYTPEASEDESELLVRFSPVPFCHLPSSGGLGCAL